MEPIPLSGGEDGVERARELVKIIAAEIDDNMMDALNELQGLLAGLGVHGWAKTWIEIRYGILGLRGFRKYGRRLTSHMNPPKKPMFIVGACPHCGRRTR